MEDVCIEKALPGDLPEILRVFATARQAMAENGNATQWTDGYPSEECVRGDIRDGWCYVCRTPEGRVAGTFCLIFGEDPTYAEIYDGAWLNAAPYATLHRLASDGTVRGLGRRCIAWALRRCGNLRVDTHRDNAAMRHLLRDMAFRQCGTILCRDGSPRLAFQRCHGNDATADKREQGSGKE